METNLTHLAPAQLFESPTNPRKIIDKEADAELEQSVSEHGILQALLVRPRSEVETKDGQPAYEVVIGSRRLRIASKLKLPKVPVTIREMTDDQVVEAQLVENLQRKDIHPLDEADGYRRLVEERGLAVTDVAAKVGRPSGYVYQRMKLCALGKAGRKAFLAGELTAATALIVARVPDAKRQAKAVEAVTRVDWRGDRPSAREASRIVQQDFMLRLADAPFKTDDAELVDKAGPCTTCPKRTGCQPELFDDVDSDDLCTDSACYQAKVEAHWAGLQALAKDKGWPVVTKKAELKKLFPYGDFLASSAPYIDLDGRCPEDPKSRKYRTLLGKGCERTLAMAPGGKVFELFPKKGLTKALKDRGHDFKAASAGGGTAGASAGTASKDEAKKAKAARALRERTVQTAVGEVVARVERRKPTLKFWRALAESAVKMALDYGGELCERRGWTDDKATDDHAKKVLAKMSEGELRGVVFEALLPPEVFWRGASSGGSSPELKALCKEYGVDLKKAEAAAKKALEAEQKAAEAKKAQAKADKQKHAGKPNGKAASKKRGSKPNGKATTGKKGSDAKGKGKAAAAARAS
ncbi:MAG: ParB/RepB/Spo0J family partition protein [Gammaproteobacteria bacterium]|nr:ParB/RepB/Spo0J family partition protein [Gammaproteobacteria bacterium]NIR85186.1 ParB/RepB/Spo0J family partition protein [Gammaproteobacteria bacterium]NIU06235.1 ParB/RepB/Spo0J family partition protein [Gammaproteobacteria bacterium]NIX87508.1 ParB/RepB/Spo0J family partition protein [Gammaproteobacteria bacterium]